MISELGLGAAKPVTTPLEPNIKLTTKELDELTASSSKGEKDPPTDPSIYQRIIGNLLYLTSTRPDIAFSVQTLSQFLHQPKKSHLEAAMRIVRYVKNQPGQGILLSSSSQEEIQPYCDADWVACPNSKQIVIGFPVKLGNSLISWKSKKQSTVSRSSAKAEYRSMASTAADLSCILGLVKELGT